MRQSQCEAVLRHLRKFGSITPLEALRKYGCMRLGARIYDLRRDGRAIKRQFVERGGKRFARYSLS